MTKKRKIIIISAAAVVAVGVLACCYFLLGKGTKTGGLVYVMPVSDISGSALSTGGVSRYIGVVDPQETKNINLDSQKTLKEVFVAVGDEVKTGDKLFSYDTDTMELELAQLNVDIQRSNAEISDNYAEIKRLQAEKASASSDMQLDYSLNIQSLQTATKSLEYSLKAKQLEVKQKKQSIENSVVFSEMDGTIKSINTTGATDQSGNTAAFMTIMASGEFLVKGTIGELSIGSIYEGMPVLVRSRVDENVTWKGKVKKIDTSPSTDSGNGNFSYGSSNSSTQSSKYKFYVELETIEGLMLGQHVTIEPDYGQGQAQADTEDGIKLPAWYIGDADSDSPYVWKQVGNKIRKQQVVLGSYNEQTGEYVITDGLTRDDYIAFPDGSIIEGTRTTTVYQEQTEQPEGESEAPVDGGAAIGEGDVGMEPEAEGQSGEVAVG